MYLSKEKIKLFILFEIEYRVYIILGILSYVKYYNIFRYNLGEYFMKPLLTFQ